MPLEPGNEGRHRIEVFSECSWLRRSVILESQSDDSPLTGPNNRDLVALREAEDHIRVYEITIGVESDLLQILFRCLVPVTAVVGQREAPLQEPAAEWMVDGPNANAEEHEFDPAQGCKRRQFEYIVGPAKRPGQVVRDDSRSGNDKHVHAADRAQALDPVNQLERYALESNSENPRQSTRQSARPRSFCGSLDDCFRGKSRDVVARPHILRVRAET